MEDGKKTLKKKCKTCSAFVLNETFTYCASCNKKYNNELAIFNKYMNEEDYEDSEETYIARTVNYYITKLIDMFKLHNEIILSFQEKNKYIASEVIQRTKHMGYEQYPRRREKERTKKPPYLELEYIKAPLRLMPALIQLNKERRDDD